jgi:hypothetical protein
MDTKNWLEECYTTTLLLLPILGMYVSYKVEYIWIEKWLAGVDS